MYVILNDPFVSFLTFFIQQNNDIFQNLIEKCDFCPTKSLIEILKYLIFSLLS